VSGSSQSDHIGIETTKKELIDILETKSQSDHIGIETCIGVVG
jgi:hypothetical protein